MGITRGNEKIRIMTILLKDDESRKHIENIMGRSIYDDMEEVNKELSDNNTVEGDGVKLTVLSSEIRINAGGANYKYVYKTTAACDDTTWVFVRGVSVAAYECFFFKVLENDEERLVVAY